MKEQRQRIEAVNNAVETALPDVEYSKSRFVDTGFVRPVQKQELSVNTVLQAVEAGTNAYKSSKYYKDLVRKENVTAYNQVSAELAETDKYIVDNNLNPEEVQQYMFTRTSELLANVPSDASHNFKDKYTSSLISAFGGKTRKAIASNALFQKEEDQRQLDTAFFSGGIDNNSYIQETSDRLGAGKGNKHSILNIVDKLHRDYSDLPYQVENYNKEMEGLATAWVKDNGPIDGQTSEFWQEDVQKMFKEGELPVHPLAKLQEDILSIRGLQDQATGLLLNQQFNGDPAVAKALKGMESIVTNYRVQSLIKQGVSPEDVGDKFGLSDKEVKNYQLQQRELFVSSAASAFAGDERGVKQAVYTYSNASEKEKKKLSATLKTSFRSLVLRLKEEPNGGAKLLELAANVEQKGMSEIRNILDDEPFYKAVTSLDDLGLPKELIPQALLGVFDDSGKGIPLETVRKELGGKAEDLEKAVSKMKNLSDPDKKNVLDTGLRVLYWSENNGSILGDMGDFIEKIAPNSYTENKTGQPNMPGQIEKLSDLNPTTPKEWTKFKDLPVVERLSRIDALLRSSPDLPRTPTNLIDYSKIDGISVEGFKGNTALRVNFGGGREVFYNVSEDDFMNKDVALSSKLEQERVNKLKALDRNMFSVWWDSIWAIFK
jgi:hypothetical protein